MIVVGEKEEKDGSVAVRIRESREQSVFTLEKFAEKAEKEIRERH